MSLELPNNNAVHIGEPNCMKCIVDCIRSGEESGTLAKVATYALTFIVTVIACLSLVGIYFVIKAASEYSRQTTEGEVQQILQANDVRVNEAFDRVREQDARVEATRHLTPEQFRSWKTRGVLPQKADAV